ncbi:RsmE family RNA methyltransferase, partial [Sphingomonas sp. TDK1]|uniref:RsmE family RNA methyltransferase n=1 Tax=Sphingomonas sp. TDK1 TaxID=453247 RepID=UPI001E543EE0
MPATPAWPPQSAPRLFVDGPLEPGLRRIDGPQAHYLGSVMRLKPGEAVKLFDGTSGEWLGIARDIGKRDLTLEVTEQLRPHESVPDLWLCAAPIKKGRIDWVAEKACELGVARLVPVLTRRTVIDRLNL